MGRNEDIFVTDACTWRDLEAGGIHFKVFLIPGRWIIPDPVVNQLKRQIPHVIDSLFTQGAEQMELSGDLIKLIDVLLPKYRKIDYYDASALVLARSLDGFLISSDADLREVAEKESVPVHGTLWILDKLVEEIRCITPHQGGAALREMLRRERRLPLEECKERINGWK